MIQTHMLKLDPPYQIIHTQKGRFFLCTKQTGGNCEYTKGTVLFVYKRLVILTAGD